MPDTGLFKKAMGAISNDLKRTDLNYRKFVAQQRAIERSGGKRLPGQMETALKAPVVLVGESLKDARAYLQKARDIVAGTPQDPKVAPKTNPRAAATPRKKPFARSAPKKPAEVKPPVPAAEPPKPQAPNGVYDRLVKRHSGTPITAPKARA